jgi:hypothetical protein
MRRGVARSTTGWSIRQRGASAAEAARRSVDFALSRQRRGTLHMDIKIIGVIGAGTMGNGRGFFTYG